MTFMSSDLTHKILTLFVGSVGKTSKVPSFWLFGRIRQQLNFSRNLSSFRSPNIIRKWKVSDTLSFYQHLNSAACFMV